MISFGHSGDKPIEFILILRLENFAENENVNGYIVVKSDVMLFGETAGLFVVVVFLLWLMINNLKNENIVPKKYKSKQTFIVGVENGYESNKVGVFSFRVLCIED